MTLILNLLWVLLGGFVMAIAWFAAELLAAISIVGLPWARACFNIASFTLWPFGREAVSRRSLTGRDDVGTGPLGLAGNIVWVVLAGLWLALGHLAAALACAATIVGLPFAWQHVKLAGLSLAPVGMAVVRRADVPRRY